MLEIVKMSQDNYKDVSRIAKENLAEGWGEETFFSQLSNKHDYCFVAYFNNEIAGFLDVWNVFGELDINNIAVSKKFRRKGIGYSLMKNMESHFFDAVSCTLEVRESNKNAISLYEKCGFKEVGKRKNFYSKPLENAIIMKKIYKSERDNDF